MTNSQNEKNNSSKKPSRKPFTPKLNQKVFIRSISRKGVVKSILVSKPDVSKVTYYTSNGERKTQWFFNSNLREFKEKKVEQDLNVHIQDVETPILNIETVDLFNEKEKKSISELADIIAKYREPQIICDDIDLNEIKDYGKYEIKVGTFEPVSYAISPEVYKQLLALSGAMKSATSPTQDVIDGQKDFNAKMKQMGVSIGTETISDNINGRWEGVKVLETPFAPPNPLQIKVKYFTDIEPLAKISKGDYIDLRCAEDIEMKAGEFKLIPLGVGMKLPYGYEANFVPRSSTFKNFGIIQTNHYSVIDNSYSGNNDQWLFPAYATRDTKINKNDRICQFRINRIMEDVEVVTVNELDEVDRGGLGSTGVQ